MWKYILKRILLIFMTAFIILSLTFILMKLLKESVPAGLFAEKWTYFETQVNYGYMYRVDAADAASAQFVISDSRTGVYYYYSSYSVMEQYGRWLGNIVTKWDWGTSTAIETNRDAMSIILSRLPMSLKINVIAVVIAVPLGFAFGILAALKKNTWIDNTISTLTMVFISVPSFVIISFLMIWLAYGVNVLPSQWPESTASASTQAAAYVIPVMSLCFGTVASFTRYTRAELCDIMASDFLLLARTKGLTRPQTVIRHALRNSMVPLVPMIIGEFIGILSGSMILENLYGIPGIGDLFIKAINSKDYNVVMVDMAVYTMISLFATLLVDLSYGIVDPRIRMGAKK